LDEEIATGLEGIQKIMQNWAAENDLEFDIIDPTILTDACDLCIKMLVANMGHPLWMDSNLVHLTPDGYWDLAAVISDSA
jgi:hypothetical protein